MGTSYLGRRRLIEIILQRNVRSTTDAGIPTLRLNCDTQIRSTKNRTYARGSLRAERQILRKVLRNRDTASSSRARSFEVRGDKFSVMTIATRFRAPTVRQPWPKNRTGERSGIFLIAVTFVFVVVDVETSTWSRRDRGGTLCKSSAEVYQHQRHPRASRPHPSSPRRRFTFAFHAFTDFSTR